MKRILAAAIVGTVLLTPRIQGGILRPIDVGDLWVLSVGINEYDDSGPAPRLFKLQSAVQDAEAIADALRKTALAPAFKRQVHVALLLDAAATRAGILAKLGELSSQVKPEDTFVLFLAGHGYKGDDDYAFVAADANSKQLASVTGRELKLWTDRIAARNQLLILDSSESAAAEEAFARRLSADHALLRDLDDRNVTVLGYDGAGLEIQGHGLLTAAVLDGLKGAADLVDGCGPVGPIGPNGWVCTVPGITAREIEAYAAARLLQLSGTQTRLQSYAQGGDFLLAVGKQPDAVQAARGAMLELSATPTPSPASPARRDYALLVGVDEYDHFPKLANPVFDVETVATELREEYGFETDILRNSTQLEIFNKLRELANREFGPEDQVLVFIAGHGEYFRLGADGEGYLIARDSRPQRDGGVNPLSHANVLRILQNVRANHLMFVLDSCFSGTFEALLPGGARSDPYDPAAREEVIRRNLKLKAKMWLTSSGRQYVSDGIKGSHSPFARTLLQTLRRNQGAREMLTSAQLFAGMQELSVMPRYGSFPDSEPGAQFLFVPPPR